VKERVEYGSDGTEREGEGDKERESVVMRGGMGGG